VVPQAGVIDRGEPEHAECTRAHRDVQEAARTKGLQLNVLKAQQRSEIDTAFASLVQCRMARCRSPRIVIEQPRSERLVGAGIAPCSSKDICVARVRRFRRPDQLGSSSQLPFALVGA